MRLVLTILPFHNYLCFPLKVGDKTNKLQRSVQGPFILYDLRLRFVFASHGLYGGWLCCRNWTLWTLALNPAQSISCDKKNHSRNLTVWTNLKTWAIEMVLESFSFPANGVLSTTEKTFPISFQTALFKISAYLTDIRIFVRCLAEMLALNGGCLLLYVSSVESDL